MRSSAAVGKRCSASFDTIAAALGNAALPHYHPTEKTNARTAPGTLLLVDSGRSDTQAKLEADMQR